MPNESAGVLVFRRRAGAPGQIEVLLVHPGGPFWKNKDAGAWTIPKGEPNDGEDLLKVAIREFHEETGLTPRPPFQPLNSVRQKGGKVVHAWAFEGNCDPASIVSNTLAQFHAIAERWTIPERWGLLLTHIFRRWLGGKWLRDLPPEAAQLLSG